MIGVVVWASEIREKAIIWCEDQATLAYLQGRENLSSAEASWPRPGDLVELETETLGSLRHARGVTLISEQCCPDLPRLLADAKPTAAAEPTHLRVVSSTDIRPAPAADEAACAFPRIGAAG
ncbi:hypothetical protein [Paracoccus tibetensis]|uniref:Uncharacterized protein n=1 Tax=Paracoccus tibetensis TaxID=336292 RepID=A0A1G5BKU6_9RHOB|nr:hypothetical protein [Paracoccus tibetensis]SCX90714.1 hypothetical protein SAMN05660710_00185 [Paracoccus tibetensis]